MTLDSVADESRKMMADGVARSPSQLCSRDGNICSDKDALSTISLFACFCAVRPTFRFSSFVSFLIFFLHPDMFVFFVSLRLCSIHLLLSARTYFIVRFLSACVICTLPHLGTNLFSMPLVSCFVALTSRVTFLLLCYGIRYVSN